ncbi:helix-turn-helix domain-containing protein [Kitasatospora acidiphila]|uniref:Helix-turn-helix domain-containing protein n=1 Tax=Kitasatospora acidiphila TaxID=2567942 RepID=A0A540W0E5_9ACTN|nr:helix-turn-helix domain-containing protein [Kitasatospora acidiphila]TQF02480.1 helix-turn-helix domain-containing protein [Kitasatospora acidiphila]
MREAAGNPTYRALATTAGFGATTLSDAAGGVRQPSLEVTLAYVGACGGDVAAWEQRWRELNRTLEEQRAGAKHEDADEPEAQAGEPAPAGSDTPSADAPSTDAPSTEPLAPDAPAPDASSATAAAPGAAEPDAPSAEAPAPGAAEPDGDGDSPESNGHPGAPARPMWRRPVTIAAVAVIALIATLLVTRPPIMEDAKAQESTPSACGPVPPPAATGAGSSDFVGITYGDGAHVRTGASRNSPTIRTIPAGCQLHFTGYCLGDVIYDSHGASADMRWFELYGGGVIASAIIHGNPPNAMAPSQCPADRPMPDAISLNMMRTADASDTVRLWATGTNLGIVGFAARYVTPSIPPSASPTARSTAGSSPVAGTTGQPTPTGNAAPAAPTWHHLDVINSDTNAFSYPWRLGPLSGTEQPGNPGTAIAVIAVACLGGDGPTDVTDVRLVPAPSSTDPAQQLPSPPQQIKLSAAEQITASHAACRYPDVNG